MTAGHVCLLVFSLYIFELFSHLFFFLLGLGAGTLFYSDLCPTDFVPLLIPVLRIQIRDPDAFLTPGWVKNEHPGTYFRELIKNFWVKNTIL
jgi:hypothetical protein